MGGSLNGDWAKTCEWCKGYPTVLNSCACPTAHPVPTSPERPSNKPQMWWALKVMQGPLAGFWVHSGGGFSERDGRALYASEEAARRAAKDFMCEGITMPYEVEEGPSAKTMTTLRAEHPNGFPADPVNHPPHYTAGGIEAIDAIEAALTAEEFRGYCKGNALKYVWREKHKGQNESLRKAIWYLNRLVND